MGNETIIKAGYRITVGTWENDGDNDRTKVMEGVSKEHIPFIAAVCNLFESGSRNANCFGNMYEPSEQEVNALQEALRGVIEQHASRPDHCDSPEAVLDTLGWGLGLTGGEFYTRVFESIKVEYIPQDIMIQDVTHEFV